MKKILFLIIALTSSALLFSQNSYKVFCDLKGTDNVSGKNVSVTIVLDKQIEMNELVSANGEKLKITQMVEAMNFMSKLWWKFESCYAIFGSGRTVHHWIISKEVKEEKEIKSGLITEEQYRNQKQH